MSDCQSIYMFEESRADLNLSMSREEQVTIDLLQDDHYDLYFSPSCVYNVNLNCHLVMRYCLFYYVET